MLSMPDKALVIHRGIYLQHLTCVWAEQCGGGRAVQAGGYPVADLRRYLGASGLPGDVFITRGPGS